MKLTQKLLEHEVETLASTYQSIDAQDQNKQTALHSAALEGHIDIVQLLIENGLLWTQRTKMGRHH